MNDVLPDMSATLAAKDPATPASSADAARIAFLDGIRGLAILAVILFHSFARWPDIVPYGNQYADIPFMAYGWLGVQLFFLVSGFVILMTLEKCLGIGDFLLRRWLRLFPAMLFASLLIYLSAGFFHERPGGMPTLDSLLPGLTFIDFSWWKVLFGFPEKPLEGAFWSLYVEFRFYVFAGCLYFWLGRDRMLVALVAAYALGTACVIAADVFPGQLAFYAGKAALRLGLNHFGWFAAGALFFVYWQTRSARWFWLATGMAVLSAVFVRQLDWSALLPALLVCALFAGALLSARLQRLLSSRVLLFYGFISYPLYLIHENMLIAMIVKADHYTDGLPPFLLPLLPLLVLSVIAWLIATYVEPAIRARLPAPRR